MIQSYCYHLYRKCFNTILKLVKLLPDYFEKFCLILRTDPQYREFVESMIVSCVVYNSEDEIKQHVNIDTMAVCIGDLLDANKVYVAALDSNGGSDAIRNGASREDYFVAKGKNPEFIKMFMKCLALDIENNSELYLLLQSLIDSLRDTVDSPSMMNLAASVEYKDHLKLFYLQNTKPVAEENFEGPNITHALYQFKFDNFRTTWR